MSNLFKSCLTWHGRRPFHIYHFNFVYSFYSIYSSLFLYCFLHFLILKKNSDSILTWHVRRPFHRLHLESENTCSFSISSGSAALFTFAKKCQENHKIRKQLQVNKCICFSANVYAVTSGKLGNHRCHLCETKKHLSSKASPHFDNLLILFLAILQSCSVVFDVKYFSYGALEILWSWQVRSEKVGFRFGPPFFGAAVHISDVFIFSENW